MASSVAASFTRVAARASTGAIAQAAPRVAAATAAPAHSFNVSSSLSTQPADATVHSSVAAAMAALAQLPTNVTPFSCVSVGNVGLYIPSPLEMPMGMPLPAGLEETIVGDVMDEDTGVDFVKRQYIPSFIKRKRTHGWRKRMSTPGGRAVIKRRVTKGRKRITV
jgi:large subunit ribosomal protein L34